MKVTSFYFCGDDKQGNRTDLITNTATVTNILC